MTKIYNKKSEKEKRRALRSDPTLAEKVLWLSLRKKQIHGVRFLRQYSVNKFVLDFYSPAIRLAIEADGDSHIGNEAYDLKRQGSIESFNIKFIRYTNEQILGNINKVVKDIEKVVEERLKQTPPCPPL